MNNSKTFRSNPMIASLHKRAANDLDHTLAVHLGYEWHTALLAMMDAGLGESVSIRYAANCLGAWLEEEQTTAQIIDRDNERMGGLTQG